MIPSQTLTSIRWIHILAMMALLLVAPMASVALGHAHLIASSPGEGESLTAMPHEVVLTYDEPVEPAGDALLMIGPDGTEHALDVAADRDPDGLRADLDEPLEAGEHTLAWRIVANDGHVQEGTVAFVVEDAALEDAAVENAQPEDAQAEDAIPDDVDSPMADAGADMERGEEDQQAQEPAAASNAGSGNGILALVLLGVGGAVALFLAVGSSRLRPGRAE